MSTPILPYLPAEPGATQVATQYNDLALRLEILTGLVISASTTAQPGAPAEGAIYIIPAAATGAQWSTFSQNDLVIYKSGTWYPFAPVNGIVVNLAGVLKRWNGTAYVDAASGGGTGDVVGPASAVGDNVAVYNGTTGKLIKDGGAKVADLRADAIGIAVSDESTALTTGTAKVTFRMPYAFTLTGVRCSVTTAPTGAVLTVDINEAGASILSTKLTIDAGEKTSTTAATAPVISDTTLADDAEMTVDIDTVGSTIAGAGLKIWLIGYKTP